MAYRSQISRESEVGTELAGEFTDGHVRLSDDGKEHAEKNEEDEEREEEEEERTKNWIAVVEQSNVKVSEDDSKQRKPFQQQTPYVNPLTSTVAIRV